MTSPAGRPVPRWILVLLALGALSTPIPVLGLAWLTVWFQLFGETPDRGDYAVAAGLCTAGAAFTALAGLTARLVRAPRWLTVWSWASTGLLVAVASGCWADGRDAEADRYPSGDTFGDGVLTALQMPWSWLLVAALLAALAVRVSGGSAGPGRPGS